MWPGQWGGSCTERSRGHPAPPMTNRIALFLAAVVLGIIAADLLVFHWGLALATGRRFIDLVEYLAFWR